MLSASGPGSVSPHTEVLPVGPVSLAHVILFDTCYISWVQCSHGSVHQTSINDIDFQVCPQNETHPNCGVARQSTAIGPGSLCVLLAATSLATEGLPGVEGAV